MTALVADGTLWLAVPIALLAGIVSFASPCVLPLVPGYLGFISGAAVQADAAASRATVTSAVPAAASGAMSGSPSAVGPNRRRLVAGVLLFIAGFTVVFIAMNVLGGTVGRFLLVYKNIITPVMGVLIILLGLVFVGAFRFAQHTIHLHVPAKTGPFGAVLLGFALGIGWAPCIGPTLAVILGMSVDGSSAGRGALLGLAYSLGLGIPFLLVAAGFSWATHSMAYLRRHVRTVNVVGGIMLTAIGTLMVTGLWNVLTSHLQGLINSTVLPI